MEKNEIISSGVLELYVSGACTPAEAADVERWRVEFPEVAGELNKIEAAFEAYAFANAVAPSPAVQNKITASLFKPEIAGAAPIRNISAAKVVSISPVWRAVAAAAIFLLAGSLIFNLIYFNKADRFAKQSENDRAMMAAQTAQLNERTSELSGMNRDMNVIQSRYSRPVSLDGLDASPEAGAKIFWMKNTGEVYIDATNLPEAPGGMEYQLWGIVDGKPVSGGMIANGKQLRIQKMKAFGKAEAFAVTLETKGGHEQPEGKMYVLGKI